MSADRANVLRMRTPEGVAFSLQIASPVLRLVAMAVDWAVVSAAWSVAAGLVKLLAPISIDIAGMAQIATFFLLSQGYRIGAEWRWNGQTIGKRLLRLRVVDSAGGRLAFEQVVIRNLLRFADVLPGAYLLGGATAILSPRGQRLHRDHGGLPGHRLAKPRDQRELAPERVVLAGAQRLEVRRLGRLHADHQCPRGDVA